MDHPVFTPWDPSFSNLTTRSHKRAFWAENGRTIQSGNGGGTEISRWFMEPSSKRRSGRDVDSYRNMPIPRQIWITPLLLSLGMGRYEDGNGVRTERWWAIDGNLRRKSCQTGWGSKLSLCCHEGHYGWLCQIIWAVVCQERNEKILLVTLSCHGWPLVVNNVKNRASILP